MTRSRLFDTPHARNQVYDLSRTTSRFPVPVYIKSVCCISLFSTLVSRLSSLYFSILFFFFFHSIATRNAFVRALIADSLDFSASMLREMNLLYVLQIILTRSFFSFLFFFFFVKLLSRIIIHEFMKIVRSPIIEDEFIVRNATIKGKEEREKRKENGWREISFDLESLLYRVKFRSFIFHGI